MKSRVRIIGGKWRGSKLPVFDAEGLRPTPDRIRETLFNWLAAQCPGAMVLDCFAGSGALGFEALSRGARGLVALERHPRAIDNLRLQAQKLNCDRVEIIAGDALQAIGDLRQSFDLVFVDPPYANAQLRRRVVELLESGDCLNPGARIYFEWPKAEGFELPSQRLHWLKRKTAGQVDFALAEWRPDS
jgi:16S rRNA (guanine966-N2)-methyltransferase